MNKRKIYIAYGSNMNREQMAARCPEARLLGTGTLHGYRLLFRGPHDGAVATVERYSPGKVPVVLWSITAADEEALDHYEGWPWLYRKQLLAVEYDGSLQNGMAYVMNPGRPLGQPSPYYYAIIRDGYKEAGLDTEILRQATVACT